MSGQVSPPLFSHGNEAISKILITTLKRKVERGKSKQTPLPLMKSVKNRHKDQRDLACLNAGNGKLYAIFPGSHSNKMQIYRIT